MGNGPADAQAAERRQRLLGQGQGLRGRRVQRAGGSQQRRVLRPHSQRVELHQAHEQSEVRLF